MNTRNHSQQLPSTFPRRKVVSLGMWENKGWRLKAYGLSASGAPPDDEFVREAERIARRAMRGRNDQPEVVGCAIVHAGQDGNYVLIGWWDAAILRHRLYGAAHGQPRLKRGWPGGAAFCVWELGVYWHEREAWVRHVLSRGREARIDKYLEDRLVGFV